jgi:ribosomal RNA-processing protein 1
MTASVKGAKASAVAMPQSADVPIEVKIAQKLASNEPKIRDRAVKKLTKWLSARSASTATSFSKDEMLRLWKGLYYCFWMSDKPLVQEELAENIGKLIHCFEANDTNSELFIR